MISVKGVKLYFYSNSIGSSEAYCSHVTGLRVEVAIIILGLRALAGERVLIAACSTYAVSYSFEILTITARKLGQSCRH